MRDEPVPEKEFREQKRSMIASFALSLENPQRMIGYYVTSWRYDLPADYWDKYPERITAVTPAQVQAAAKKYLDPARLQIVAVGDPTKVGETLKRSARSKRTTPKASGSPPRRRSRTQASFAGVRAGWFDRKNRSALRSRLFYARGGS